MKVVSLVCWPIYAPEKSLGPFRKKVDGPVSYSACDKTQEKKYVVK
jgi:hypothetical protein